MCPPHSKAQQRQQSTELIDSACQLGVEARWLTCVMPYSAGRHCSQPKLNRLKTEGIKCSKEHYGTTLQLGFLLTSSKEDGLAKLATPVILRFKGAHWLQPFPKSLEIEAQNSNGKDGL